ncbi:hypothetical protein [Nitrosomonas sp. Nm51]|uniref:hypothetical protein n=1 Tax=Nitrosomonas sp. Nm51 TaxID=133720 RepID=UPI001C431642|nr:hypothetical protein [Nitrosomonas sp. Nm51]
MSYSDAAAILIEIPINHIVTAILDRPVTAIHFEYTLWTCLFRRATGYMLVALALKMAKMG